MRASLNCSIYCKFPCELRRTPYGVLRKSEVQLRRIPLLRTRVNSSRDSLPGQEDGQRVQRRVRPGSNRRRTDLEGDVALRFPEQSTNKCLNHPQIELASRFAPELLERFRGRTLWPVGPAPNHHVVGVPRRHYACGQGDLLPFEPIGVARSVRTLVVMPDHREHPEQRLYRFDHACSYLRVAFDGRPFFLRKGTGLSQDLLCHTDLSNIVQERTVHEPLQSFFVEA